MQEPASLFLAYVVFPLWVAAGFADWLCHLRTGIAQTSGLKENLLHLLMFGEIGAGIAAVVLLEINAAVLMLVLVVFVVHELTVYWDLSYSTMLRDVGPFEQMVHSFLEMLPLLALALLMAVGASEAPVDWSLRLKEQPLPVQLRRGRPAAGRGVQRCAAAAGNLVLRQGASPKDPGERPRPRFSAARRPATRPASRPSSRRWNPPWTPRRGLLRLVLLRALHPDEGLHVDHVARLEAGLAVQVAAHAPPRRSAASWYSGHEGVALVLQVDSRRRGPPCGSRAA